LQQARLLALCAVLAVLAATQVATEAQAARLLLALLLLLPVATEEKQAVQEKAAQVVAAPAQEAVVAAPMSSTLQKSILPELVALEAMAAPTAVEAVAERPADFTPTLRKAGLAALEALTVVAALAVQIDGNPLRMAELVVPVVPTAVTAQKAAVAHAGLQALRLATPLKTSCLHTK
jgi:hypothetical protein